MDQTTDRHMSVLVQDSALLCTATQVSWRHDRNSCAILRGTDYPRGVVRTAPWIWGFGKFTVLTLLWTNISYTERKEVSRDSFPPSAVKNFQGFPFCATVYLLTLSCIFFQSFSLFQPCFCITCPSTFSPCWSHPGAKRNIPLCQNLEYFIFSRSNIEHSLYNSVVPLLDLGEVPFIWISSPPCPTDRGTVASSSMHSCPQGPLSHIHTTHSASEEAAEPLFHQDCLSLSWKRKRTLAQRAAAVWVLLVVG